MCRVKRVTHQGSIVYSYWTGQLTRVLGLLSRVHSIEYITHVSWRNLQFPTITKEITLET